MRESLQRLLRRPSALSLLDRLVSTPPAIDQLFPSRSCLHCRSYRSLREYSSGRRRFAEDQPVLTSKRSVGKSRGFSNNVRRPQVLFPVATPRSTEGKSEWSIQQNLFTFEKVQYESDLGHCREIGSRLVDRPENRKNWALWAALLQSRQRHFGDDGIKDIWKGLTIRNGEGDLPDYRPPDVIWDNFISLGLRDETFLNDLCSYVQQLWQKPGNKANKTSQRRRDFYVAVIGGLLKSKDPSRAFRWHQRLQVHRPNSRTLRDVFPAAASSKRGLRAFRLICSTVEDHEIYADVVPSLWEVNRYADAFKMHDFLLSRNDLPKSSDMLKPLMEYIADHGTDKDFDKFKERLVTARVPFDTTAESMNSEKLFSRESMNLFLGEAHGIKPKTFTDEFCARLFATKAFNFNFVLRGLKMFGTGAIGPISLRELAIRAETPEAVSERISSLQEAGISIGESVFARLVRKAAIEGKATLLSDLLNSDQHPDVLEDWKLQESLLATYHQRKDWRQFDRTIAILCVGRDENIATRNLVLRSYLTCRDWPAVTRTLEDMREHRIPVTTKSWVWMFKSILRPRRPGHRPVAGSSFDDISFLISLWQGVLQSGSSIPAESWKEPLRRLGMTGRWDELVRIGLWLAAWYSPKREGQFQRVYSISKGYVKLSHLTQLQLPPSHPSSALSVLFSVPLQRAIVAWGFIHPPTSNPSDNTALMASSGSTTHHRPLIPWVRGILLLHHLRTQYGVSVNPNLVRDVCRSRLQILFATQYRSNIRRNRLQRSQNEYSVKQFVADADIAWGSPLFGELKNDPDALVTPSVRKMHRLKYEKQKMLEDETRGKRLGWGRKSRKIEQNALWERLQRVL